MAEERKGWLIEGLLGFSLLLISIVVALGWQRFDVQQTNDERIEAAVAEQRRELNAFIQRVTVHQTDERIHRPGLNRVEGRIDVIDGRIDAVRGSGPATGGAMKRKGYLWVDWVELGCRGWAFHPHGATCAEGEWLATLHRPSLALSVCGDAAFVAGVLNDLCAAGMFVLREPPVRWIEQDGSTWTATTGSGTSTLRLVS